MNKIIHLRNQIKKPMRYSRVSFGTLTVNAFEMIKGVPEKEIRSRYRVSAEGDMQIGMNGLVVTTGNRMIVVDPGCAGFLPATLRESYGLRMEASPGEMVRRAGYDPDAVTDVLFTHLHFDHGSGAFRRVRGGIEKAFPNARYVVHKPHLEYAMKPLRMEEDSFFNRMLRYAGELTFLEDWTAEGVTIFESSGHTRHMISLLFSEAGEGVAFPSDLVPMELFADLSAYSGYDIHPGRIRKERKKFLAFLEPDTAVILYHEPPGS